MKGAGVTEEMITAEKSAQTATALREIAIYQTDEGNVNVEILLQNENLWLTQERMSELFDVGVPAISKHLKNLFAEGELEEEATVSKMEIVRKEGNRNVKRELDFYSLDAIIAVGYRVNSNRATKFRIWATGVLHEYIQKGFAMNDERLKNPEYTFGQDYFEEQLERIRDIRSSERRFYQKITDIYAQCSADYDPQSDTTRQFYATVQNKLHWAITSETAAEIVYHRADCNKENMGLTNWKNGPAGKIRKPDVSIAKNYLSHDEIKNLNEIVTMYLDYANRQANNRVIMYMDDWIDKLDSFMQFNEWDVLHDSGKVTHEIAKAFAEGEFEKFNQSQLQSYQSDFDLLIAATDKS